MLEPYWRDELRDADAYFDELSKRARKQAEFQPLFRDRPYILSKTPRLL
jgi:hypothetical protein